MQTSAVISVKQIRERLNLLQLQMNWLQHEMGMLQRALEVEPTQTPRPFASLYGAWADVEITEQDLQDARLRIPEDLK